MLRKLLNQCAFTIRLETEEPLLVMSGDSVVNGPDMTFVRTHREGSAEPFIPGSSLKGVLRSHAERIARTLQAKSVCGVFGGAEIPGCGSRLSEAKDASDYRRSCPACRLFGSLLWKGRFSTGDAYLVDDDRDVQPELRDGVGIDRISGGAARGAKFDLEVMPAGVSFRTEFDLVNFEAWQLGWIAYVVRDLTEARLRVGAGTSRGLGRVRGHLESVDLSYVGEPAALGEEIPGIGALVSQEERDDYGLYASDAAALPDELDFGRPTGAIRSQMSLADDEEQQALLAAVAPAFDRFISLADPIEA
jgi:CRISPR-associated RAMP protein (TIGR02581 family)